MGCVVRDSNDNINLNLRKPENGWLPNNWGPMLSSTSNFLWPWCLLTPLLRLNPRFGQIVKLKPFASNMVRSSSTYDFDPSTLISPHGISVFGQFGGILSLPDRVRILRCPVSLNAGCSRASSRYSNLFHVYWWKRRDKCLKSGRHDHDIGYGRWRPFFLLLHSSACDISSDKM